MPRFLSRSARSWKIGPVAVFRSADDCFHDVQQFLQVRGIAAGADQRADLAVEGDQAHAVLLLEHQVGQRRGRALGVFELRHRRGVAPVAHALAGVQQQVADQVRLFLELLQVVLVGPAEDFPVEVAQVVAGRVLAMLGELDREAVEGAAMHARDVALDDPPRAQRQALQPGEHLRIEIVAGRFPCAARVVVRNDSSRSA